MCPGTIFVQIRRCVRHSILCLLLFLGKARGCQLIGPIITDLICHIYRVTSSQKLLKCFEKYLQGVSWADSSFPCDGQGDLDMHIHSRQVFTISPQENADTSMPCVQHFNLWGAQPHTFRRKETTSVLDMAAAMARLDHQAYTADTPHFRTTRGKCFEAVGCVDRVEKSGFPKSMITRWEELLSILVRGAPCTNFTRELSTADGEATSDTYGSHIKEPCCRLRKRKK